MAHEINFDPQDLAEMAQAIEEACEQIDWESWDLPPNSVALVEAIPEHDLVKDQVGTLIDRIAPDAYKVQFRDNEGQPGSIMILSAKQFFKVPSTNRLRFEYP